ncbi:hypothetical protein RY27_28845, partial [Litorilinea aerophila]
MTYDIVIQGGLIVNGDGAVEADLAIQGETIAAIGLDLSGRRTIDAAGCYVIPGGVDPHVHLQMPLAGRVSTDSFLTGTVAAACGGTTTVIDLVTPQPEQPMGEAMTWRQAAPAMVAVDYGRDRT